ncbi:hypothetical protein APA386B_353 [Acetobacter pasteurianus 386B]|nr:hypothetical protein APA386B_353 [Acetobacter pasteurianus 386B]
MFLILGSHAQGARQICDKMKILLEKGVAHPKTEC